MKIFFFTLFAISIFILQLNVGIGLFALSLFLLIVLFLNFTIGLNIHKVPNHKPLIIASALNMLAFALVRPDGVHSFNDNGLSALLDIFNINFGYDQNYEDYFTIASIILLIIQLVIDIRLRRFIRDNS